MHRFYLEPALCQGRTLALSGPEAHHASQVLRVREGEPVTVLDGQGSRFQCRAESVRSRELRLAVEQVEKVPPRQCQLTLFQALPKGKLVEDIITKATELGVSRVVPVLSERVVVRLNPDERAVKQEKWNRTAIEAIKQCGSAWLPKIEAPTDLETLLARPPVFNLALVGALESDSQHPKHWIEKALKPVLSACAWIGPEGDFTPGEYHAIRSSGALPISLGSLVLRTETAALYCLSILNYELEPLSRARPPATSRF